MPTNIEFIAFIVISSIFMPTIPPIPHQDYNKFNQERGICLNLSNELRILAKTTISFLVRDNLAPAQKNIAPMAGLFANIQKKLKKNPHLYSVAGINDGLEEYIEAVLLYEYVSGLPLSPMQKFKTMPEVYLGGLSDLTGELVRLARKHNEQVQSIHDYIAKIYDALIPVSITRNSQVRSKLEAVGNNLKKLEDIMYELKLRDKL